MTLMVELLLLLTLIEFALVSPVLWPIRRIVAVGVVVGLALTSGMLLGTRPSIATVLIALISLYRVVNVLRIVQNRAKKQHLQRIVPRTTLSLFTMQLVLFGIVAITTNRTLDLSLWWWLFAVAQLCVVIALFMATRRTERTTLPVMVTEHFSDAHLPDLSVCIPARNETVALEECLRSLVANDYPKLEILVLDDCSQGRWTSDIIKSFAHEGVRFIKGSPPPDSWLAKNWAYQQLFQETSGELVLFCGVDTSFAQSTLRSLVTTMISKDKRMVSVLPKNVYPVGVREKAALLLQPARYAWELCLPRRRFNRPPVLSTCWIAQRTLIDRLGSFGAVRRNITPEAYFAKKAIARDGYSFLRSTVELAVTSNKGYTDQWETAVRTRYPQLRRRIDLVFIVSLLEFSLLVTPLMMSIVAVINSDWPVASITLLTLVISCLTYQRVTRITYQRTVLVSYILAPLAALLNIYLRHESLWRYEFGEINWKGRNVCLPVMQVIPRLPTIER